MTNLKTCPICKCRAVESATTCYECYYRFSEQSKAGAKVKSEPGKEEMKTYTVEVTEHLVCMVTVEARSESEALTKVKDMHKQETIVLGSDDYFHVTFSTNK